VYHSLKTETYTLSGGCSETLPTLRFKEDTTMKNLTVNSTLRNLFSLAIIMVELWIPQGWAATIHSVATGGNWNN